MYDEENRVRTNDAYRIIALCSRQQLMIQHPFGGGPDGIKKKWVHPVYKRSRRDYEKLILNLLAQFPPDNSSRSVGLDTRSPRYGILRPLDWVCSSRSCCPRSKRVSDRGSGS